MNFLEPFSLEETIDMINYRCERLDIPNPFTRSAMERIHKLSKGIPRLILAVASAAYDLRDMAPDDKIDADFVQLAYQSNQKPEGVEVAVAHG
jgi:type II secretory pathway predicted ATPase ExeA